MYRVSDALNNDYFRAQTLGYWTLSRDEHVVPFLVPLFEKELQQEDVRGVQKLCN